MADDKLQIDIVGDNSDAVKSIEDVCKSLEKLNTKLGRSINTTRYVSNINTVTQSLESLNNVSNTFNTSSATQVSSSLVELAKGMGKFGNKIPTRAAQSMATFSSGLEKLATTMGTLNVSNETSKFVELASSISKLGGKSAERAVQYLPQLSSEITAFMTAMSQAPVVSENTIQMTNALANLASQGGKIKSATSGIRNYFNTINNNADNSNSKLQRLFNTITSGSKKSSGGMKSLSYYFGKFYASYFLLIRAFSGFKKAINYASDLTEVQNVVDHVFGDATDKIEEFSKTAIESFGMSELMAKQVASRFQAMGTAMGITNQQAQESNKTWSALSDMYDNTAQSMADVSLNLTKLTADIGSFYNMDYEEVATKLESILTGQTRPLRVFGLDLTQATISEWALTQGLEANFKTMTQAEKTMLRYQYVMAHTENIQNDFLRTSDSWANSLRILAGSFQKLGLVIGQISINAFKPLLIAINTVIHRLEDFAVAISNSLGKIFGWTYERGSSGASSELEDMADSSEDLSDGLGSAADNAKKLKSQLQGFDQLNVISSDSGSGSGSGSGGSSGGGGGATSSDSSDGKWVQKGFESELDTLGKLGSYISKKLSDAMEGIDWERVYQGARNFGTGLADFLNGLITPRLFYDVGMTIANSLNTAIYSALEFGKNFDFKNLGESLASGINGFFQNFDFDALSETLNIWVDGLVDTIKSFVSTLDWKSILSEIGDFLGSLEPDTLVTLLGIIGIKKFGNNVVKAISTELTDILKEKGLSIGSVVIGISFAAVSFKLFTEATSGENSFKEKILSLASSAITAYFAGTILSGGNITVGVTVGTIVASAGAGFNIGLELGKILFPEDEEYYANFTWGALADSLGYLFTDIIPQKATKWKTAIKIVATNMADTFVYSFKASITAATVLFQPLLTAMAEVGEVSGLLDKETADNMRNFSTNVSNAMDTSIKKYEEAKKTVTTTTETSNKKLKSYGDSVKLITDNNITNINKYKNSSSLMEKSVSSDNNKLSNSYNVLSNNASTNLENMNKVTGGHRVSVSNDISKIKTDLSSYETAMDKLSGTSRAKSGDITSNFDSISKSANTNMSKSSNSVNGLGTSLSNTSSKADTLFSKNNKTFNVNTGSGISSLASTTSKLATNIASLFSYSGRTFTLSVGSGIKNILNAMGIKLKANGGAYYEGTWHSIPQYASGGIPSRGTMFVAGEAGAEAVGHINGRTEVLNESQMASVMYNAVLSGMSAAMARSGNNNVTVTLEGDAQGVFNLVRKQDRQYRNANGHSAFGY